MSLKRTDGGKESGVTFYGFEWKRLFSIGLLHFTPGSREAYHSHAFNAVTWWLRGDVVELHDDGRIKAWGPSFKPKVTLRSTFHRVVAGIRGAWALTIRGPWRSVWFERRAGKLFLLTNGRIATEVTE